MTSTTTSGVKDLNYYVTDLTARFPSASPADVQEMAQDYVEGDELRRSLIGQVIPPCPVWCTDGDTLAHDQYDATSEPDEFARVHGCYFGDAVSVLQDERITGGAVRLDPPRIAVDLVNWGEIDADGVRVLVAHLQAAIGKLGAIST